MHNPTDIMNQDATTFNRQKETGRADFLAKAVNRFSGITKNRETPRQLIAFSAEPKLS
jgi:hypothetical protein